MHQSKNNPHILQEICKGFIRPVACVGSGDPGEGLTSVHNDYTGWSL